MLEFVRIDIDSNFNLLESRAQAVIDRLLFMAQDLRNNPPTQPTIVLLDQKRPAQDVSRSFLNELTDELLLDELILRIVKIRLLLQLIKESPVPWVYASRGAVFGSYFELACACFSQVFSDQALELGFPAIEGGLFPWGGNIATVCTRFRQLAQWKEKPLIAAAEFTLNHAYCFQIAEGQWEEAVLQWLKANLWDKWQKHQAQITKPSSHADGINEAFEAGVEGLKISDQSWQKNLEDNPFATSWDLCLQLIKKSKKEIQIEDRVRVIAFLAARHLLSKPFLGWYEGFLARSLSTDIVKAVPKVDAIYIDLHFEVPPAEVMIRLLETELRLIFYSTSSEDLQRGLELAFSRIERARGLEKAQILWEAGVFWFVAAREDDLEPVFRWMVDDKVAFQYQGAGLELIRVAGNRGRAPCGICEWVDGKAQIGALISNPVFPIMGLMADAVIKTKPFASPLFSTTMFIRSICFEELLKCARIGQSDVSTVIERLNEGGWASLGSQGFWNRFLAARHALQPVEHEALSVGPKKLWVEAFDVGLWKEARALTTPIVTDLPLKSLNPVILGQHFAVLAGVLVMLLVNHKQVDSLEAADSLVSNAVGFPLALGVPSQHLLHLGAHRVMDYVKGFWPELAPEVESAFFSSKS